jgi:hypothetical protein
MPLELSFNNQEFGICSTVISQTEGGDKGLSFAFEKLGDVLNQTHTLQKELAFNGKDLFEDDVKDYHKLISAVKVLFFYFFLFFCTTFISAFACLFSSPKPLLIVLFHSFFVCVL